MLDLETLSTSSNACIVSIGAVKFNGEVLLGKWYKKVWAHSSFHISADTLAWWSKQSEGAQEAFSPFDNVDLDVALQDFSEWVGPNRDGVKIWGNGATFDNVILANAYERLGFEVPWHYRNNRCYRTILTMAKANGYKETLRQGIHHHALDDAEHQARNLSAIIRGNYLCGITI